MLTFINIIIFLTAGIIDDTKGGGRVELVVVLDVVDGDDHAAEVEVNNLVDDGHGLTMFQHDLARGQQLNTHDTHTEAMRIRRLQLLNCSIISSILLSTVFCFLFQCHVLEGSKLCNPGGGGLWPTSKGRPKGRPAAAAQPAVSVCWCIYVLCVRNKSLSERAAAQHSIKPAFEKNGLGLSLATPRRRRRPLCTEEVHRANVRRRPSSDGSSVGMY